MSIYTRAWGLLKRRIANKTSWGYLEVKTLMSECLEEAVLEEEKRPRDT